MEQDERAAADNAGCHGAAVPESDEEENAEVILDSSGGASGSEFQDPPMIPFLGSSELEALTEESSEGIAPVSNAVSQSFQNEDYENLPKRNPATTRYELRGFRPARRAIAHAMPPSSYRRLPLRSRKQPIPTRFIVVGDAASGVVNAYDHPGTPEEASCPVSQSLSLTSQPVCASAMVNAAHGDNDEAIDSTVIRSETTDAAGSSGDRESVTDAKDAAVAEAEASSSGSLSSRSRNRKQRRPDHFISDPEEAMSADRAKAHRSNTALDRFLTSSVAVGASPPEQRPGWVRKNMTADSVHHKGQPGDEEAFRAASSGGGPEEEPDGSARVLAIVAILGASLALSVVCFVLIYIGGQQTASGACDTHQKK